MKLYKIPNKTWVRTIDDGDHMDVFFFDHPDGMYSFCKDLDGNICHYSMSCEVEELPKNLLVNHKGNLIDPRNLNP